MAATSKLRVLFFDVFGTCVEQRKPVADELYRASQKAIESDDSVIDDEVRAKAKSMTYDQWFELGGKWDEKVDKFTHDSKVEHNSVDWRAVDKYRLVALHALLLHLGLIIPDKDAVASEPRVKEGSLWTDSELQHLTRVWRRLTPWPDTCRGLDLLNKQFSTVSLSNTYNELLQDLVAYGNIPFKHLYSSDMFNSYKPNPKVYLGAAEKMGVKPEECALVAAHLGDLKAAKDCGFYAIYVERSLEEKAPELRKENIPDLVVGEDEDGFVALAGRLGLHT